MAKLIIEQFYEALDRRDAATMVGLYSDKVEFRDPVFPSLKGESARNMWRMLCSRSTDLCVTTKDIIVNDSTASATWIATYTFGQSGRRVRNEVKATFQIKDGKIVRHQDNFSFWNWSRQALGPIGLLCGWNPILLKKVRTNAKKSLEKFSK